LTNWYALLAAALANLGGAEEVKAAAKQVLTLQPSFRSEGFCAAIAIARREVRRSQELRRMRPEMVDLARWPRHNVDSRPYSLRQVAAELTEYAFRGPSGKRFAAGRFAKKR
jgi:hypothetical protein